MLECARLVSRPRVFSDTGVAIERMCTVAYVGDDGTHARVGNGQFEGLLISYRRGLGHGVQSTQLTFPGC